MNCGGARVGQDLTLNFLFRKKKLEEEEAEVKRKATDAAYQGKENLMTSS